MGTNSGTPFLWGAGTSNNGLLQSAVTLLTSATGYETTLGGLASAGIVISSVSGASGVFTNVGGASGTAQATMGDVVFTAGAAFTPTAGGVLSGWFLKSRDGGSTFEFGSTSNAPGRGPDFVIPFIASLAQVAGQQTWSIGTHKVIIPAYPFKVLLQNNSNVTLGTPAGAPWNTLQLVSPTFDY